MKREEWIRNNFLEVPLTKETLHVYTVRRALFESIKFATPHFSGKLLDVGCGQMPYKSYILEKNKQVTQYIGLDIEQSTIHDTSISDLTWDGNTIPLADASIDSAMATEVLEHCFNPIVTLSEINRVLKPGGIFFFTVPFLWPLHETPFDAYRYTPFSLKMLLEKSNFTCIQLHTLGGWHASFAQILGLWAKESELNGVYKKLAMKLAKRLIPILLKADIKKTQFDQHTMITGLYGVAKKAK
jgi:ubiquinone/menaquinone biosynthesis C-methylase UbiE